MNDLRVVPPSARRQQLGPAFWIAAGWVACNVAVAALCGVLPLTNPNQRSAAVNHHPDGAHWLGTDNLGRDILSRVLYGGRPLLVVSFGAVVIGLALGGTLALIAAYRRGRIDLVLSGVATTVASLPPLLIVLAIVAFSAPGLWKSTIILGLALSPVLFRFIRWEALASTDLEFIAAARAMGASNGRVIMGDLVPNTAVAIASLACLAAATVIILEASLAAASLAVTGPSISWGAMLHESMAHLAANPWLALAPAIALSLLLGALVVMGDRLRHWSVSP